MPIIFDEIEGVVRGEEPRDYPTPSAGGAATGGASSPQATAEMVLKELSRARRRLIRLIAD